MSQATESMLLLPEPVRRRLDPLMLHAAKIRSGAMKGERRSIKRGTSIEFADYRNYVPGDDLRKLDWNVYARLERPYIKLLEDEEDLAVHLLLDCSGSMDWQVHNDNPDSDEDTHDKFLFARRLFAGLAYIALKSGDRLMMSALRGTDFEQFGPARGRGHTVSMLRYAHKLQADGVTDLNQGLRNYALREKRPGLTVIITDLFSPTGFLDGLNILLGKGHEVLIVHVLSPDEVTPPHAGDLRLVDVETGQAQEVTIDAGMRAIYQQRLSGWLDEVRNICAGRGVHYVMTQTDTPFERVLLHDLRRLSIIR
ncbi:MAG: DUF58 domain-containing protein [Aggregatilineales bacterium]